MMVFGNWGLFAVERVRGLPGCPGNIGGMGTGELTAESDRKMEGVTGAASASDGGSGEVSARWSRESAELCRDAVDD